MKLHADSLCLVGDARRRKRLMHPPITPIAETRIVEFDWVSIEFRVLRSLRYTCSA